MKSMDGIYSCVAIKFLIYLLAGIFDILKENTHDLSHSGNRTSKLVERINRGWSEICRINGVRKILWREIKQKSRVARATSFTCIWKLFEYACTGN